MVVRSHEFSGSCYLAEELDLAGYGQLTMSIERENRGLPFYLLRFQEAIPCISADFGAHKFGKFEFRIRSASNLEIGGALGAILKNWRC